MSVGNALKQGVFVVAAKRTPFGTFGGTLKAWSPTDLQVKLELHYHERLFSVYYVLNKMHIFYRQKTYDCKLVKYPEIFFDVKRISEFWLRYLRVFFDRHPLNGRTSPISKFHLLTVR